MKRSRHMGGFTLVEMAIVMAILALLLGSLLGPLSVQQEQKRRDENRQLMDRTVEALLGFSAGNRRLPCPDSDGDGLENSPCWVAASDPDGDPATDAVQGDLPAITLGLAPRDVWAHPFHYAVNAAFTVDPIADPDHALSLNTQGAGGGVLRVYDRDKTGVDCTTTPANLAENVPALILSTAQTKHATTDELENRDNDTCFYQRGYNLTAGREFDDQLQWLSSAVLFNRLLAAGVLP